MFQNYPVVIKANCVLSDDGQSAILWLRGNNDHSIHLTVVHEGMDVAKHELFGDESCESLVVRHGECIIVLARFQGLVVAYGVFQVNLGTYGRVVSMLLPMGSENIEIVQSGVAGIEESAKVEVAA